VAGDDDDPWGRYGWGDVFFIFIVLAAFLGGLGVVLLLVRLGILNPH
jgi:hypothetical protein